MNTTYHRALRELGIDPGNVVRNRTQCPKCSADRSSAVNRRKRVLWINLETGNYKCQHCEFEGRMDSDQWLDGKHQREYQRANMPVRKSAPAKYTKPKDRTKPLDEETRKWLNWRGITDKVLERNNVQMFHGKDGPFAAFRYEFAGELKRCKYRGIRSKDHWQEPNCKPMLYKLNDIRDSEYCIITEGELDALSWEVAGIEEAVSLDSGAYNPNDDASDGRKFKCIETGSRYINDKLKIYLSLDADDPGQYTTELLIDRLGRDRCYIIRYPDGCNDANDVLMTYGPEMLQQCLDEAERPKTKDVTFMEDVAEDLWADIQGGEGLVGEPCYFPAISTGFSWVRSWLYLWTGHSQHGKSELLKFLMILKSFYAGTIWAIFSPEHAPAQEYFRELIETVTGKSTQKGSKRFITREEYDAACAFINKYFIFIYPEQPFSSGDLEEDHTPKWVIEKMREVVVMYGVEGIVIDPWNQLDHDIKDKGGREDKYLEYWLKRFKLVAQIHNLYMNIVAHPRGDGQRLDTKNRPTMYQVSGGPTWKNKIDVGAVVHRQNHWEDQSDGAVQLAIEKAKKYKVFGTPGTWGFHFDPLCGWYFDEFNNVSPMTAVCDAIMTGKNPEETGEAVQAEIEWTLDEDDVPF